MQFISWDCESHLIKGGLMAPRMVCMSFATRPPGWKGEKPHTGLVLRYRARDHIVEWLQDDQIALIGHNVWYDLGLVAHEWPELLPLIFQKLQKGLIFDTQIRQQLIDIAEGELKFHYDEDGDIVRSSYHLADLSYRLNKKFVKKGSDTWRLRYALLDGVPIDQWPEDAKKYAIDDAEITLEVFEAQERIIKEADWTESGPSGKTLPNSAPQHRAAWALHLMSMWGIRTDPEAVAVFEAELQADYDRFMLQLRPSGLFNITPARLCKRGKNKGQVIPEKVTKYMKAIYERVEACYAEKGLVVPRTETGLVSTARKTLKATGDKHLMILADAGFTSKLLNTYLPILKNGTRWPINARYNVLVETGRTSCSKPNMQNPPRKSGFRACFVPRKGYVFIFSDYPTLELRTLSQVCLDLLGRSSMAEAIRRGEDLHIRVASELAGVSPEETKFRYKAGEAEFLEFRQQAKVANFGFPGGLGADSFVEYAEGVDLVVTRDKALDLKRAWHQAWTEMWDYFELVSRIVDSSDQLTQVRSGRVRGGASFCAAANGFFQGLAADGAKEALWRVAYECYVDTTSPLFGCRPVLFVHDEIGIEAPYDADPAKASAAGDRLAVVMDEAMNVWVPDVPGKCTPVMVKRWYKGAEPCRVNGMLVPSKPLMVKTEDGKEKTKWIADLPEPISPVSQGLHPSLAALLQPSAA